MKGELVQAQLVLSMTQDFPELSQVRCSSGEPLRFEKHWQ
jgi:hypothetical protein